MEPTIYYLLFIIAMDELAKTLKAKTKRMAVSYRRLQPVIIKELMFADDLISRRQPRVIQRKVQGCGEKNC